MTTYLSRAIFTLMTLILLLLGWQLIGCQSDEALFAPDPTAKTCPVATTPDQLMANFAAAYQARDLEGYAQTLHPDFVFELAPASVAAGCPASWDRTQELRVSANMFSGKDHTRDGVTVAGIARIVFDRCQPLGVWTAVDAAGDPEVLSRSYAVSVRFEQTNGHVFVVRGSCTFQVVREGVIDEYGDALRPYRILRWIDRTR